MAHLDSNDETHGMMALLGYPHQIVTGPGQYLTRSGEVVTVERTWTGILSARGHYSCGTPERWSLSGRILGGLITPNDIVARAGSSSGASVASAEA